jgi:hypothetical protein
VAASDGKTVRRGEEYACCPTALDDRDEGIPHTLDRCTSKQTSISIILSVLRIHVLTMIEYAEKPEMVREVGRKAIEASDRLERKLNEGV